MKHYMAVLAAGLLITCSCCAPKSPETKRIDNEVKEISSSLPIHAEGFGLWKSLKFSPLSNTLQYTFAVDDENVDIPGMKANPLAAKTGFSPFLTDAMNKPVIEQLARMNGKVQLVMHSPHGGQDVTLTYTPAEIKEILHSHLTSVAQAMQLYKAKIAMENAACPQPLDEGVVLTSVADSCQYAVYTCMLDSDIYNVEDMMATITEMKQHLMHSFTSQQGRGDLAVLTDASHGVIYKYMGSDGASAVVAFTPSELKSLMQ